LRPDVKLGQAAALGGGAGLALALLQLAGQPARALLRSDPAAGRALLEDVGHRLRALPGPDAWMQALFVLESIARTAREASDWELAERIARQMLEHDPAYAGGHYALGLVAERRGDTAAAQEAFAKAARLWALADDDLPELQRLRRSVAAR
jgi:tetratricopeptide (TPR) repeat protein